MPLKVKLSRTERIGIGKTVAVLFEEEMLLREPNEPTDQLNHATYSTSLMK